MSRGVRFHEFGGPGVLKIEDVVVPDPGFQEARLRIKAIGLNRSEILTRPGKSATKPTLPAQLGRSSGAPLEIRVNAVGLVHTPFIASRPTAIDRYRRRQGGTEHSRITDVSSNRHLALAVDVPSVLFGVFAVISFWTTETEDTFLQEGVTSIPKGQSKTQALRSIAEAGKAVLVPPIGARARVFVWEVLPGLSKSMLR